MITEIQATGKTVNDAVEALKVKLCVETLDEIDWKLVSAGKKGGLFGIGAQPAKVVAFVETPDPVAETPAPKAEAPKAEKKPAEKKPAEKKPADKKPADKKPADKKPAEK
ncbi:MAG: Jag N-terminal domain-containing protein, partial [Clostridia bacterium]|nr:Jag N-terminal domain-containing protein [Clostridia bacterium]